MKIIIERNVLIEALGKVNKAITGKTAQPMLNGVFLQAGKKSLILLGTDLDLSICTMVQCETLMEGKILVDSKMFTEIIKKLPNGEVTLEIVENNNAQSLNITCKKTFFNVMLMNADDYPAIPKVTDGSSIKVSKSELRQMVHEVAFAVAADEARPILQGILFEIKNKQLNLVALDGYRLAVRTTQIDVDDEIEVVINGRNFLEISKVLDGEGDVEVVITQNQALFNLGTTRVITRLMEGKFVAYRSLLPSESKIDFEVNRLELTAALERAALMAKDGQSNLCKFVIGNNGMLDNLNISAKSQIGKGSEDLSINITKGSEELVIAFNSRYFLDILKNSSNEIVELKMTSPIAPCILRGKDDETSTYLVLPVRVAK